MPNGAIGTMKMSPYTSRSLKRSERWSSCRYPNCSTLSASWTCGCSVTSPPVHAGVSRVAPDPRPAWTRERTRSRHAGPCGWPDRVVSAPDAKMDLCFEPRTDMDHGDGALAALVERARTLVRPGRRALLGITGAPGAGKTTLARALV